MCALPHPGSFYRNWGGGCLSIGIRGGKFQRTAALFAHLRPLPRSYSDVCVLEGFWQSFATPKMGVRSRECEQENHVNGSLGSFGLEPR